MVSTSSALPARATLAPHALADLQVAVLEFPFANAVAQFRRDIERVRQGRGDKNPVSMPHRRLNNALLACAPTLTHGFEYVNTDEAGVSYYQALAVGTAKSPLCCPSTSGISSLISIWAEDWTKQLRKKDDKEIDSVCDRFLDALATMPKGWDWRRIAPTKLVQDLEEEHGLGYQAIPSLLATLLHEKTIVLEGTHVSQPIRWRKVQGSTANRTGLFLVSQPVRLEYVDQRKNTQEGYFAYRLDFTIQNQAGRYNQFGKLEPQIFINLSCQRYGHERLAHSNFRRGISILVGMNEARTDSFEVDTTLVELSAEHIYKTDRGEWQERLADILREFNALPLTDPSEIFASPGTFGNLHDRSDWSGDEYYLVHAEGLKYGNKNGKNHTLATGYSLRERGEIINKVLGLLQPRLIADAPFVPDIPAPTGRKIPSAMQTYTYIAKKASIVEIRRKQTLIGSAIKRTLRGEPLRLCIIWQETATFEAITKQLHQLFLLNDGEEWPPQVEITEVQIDNLTLLTPLSLEGIDPADGAAVNRHLRKQHESKREEWRQFLRLKLPTARASTPHFAVIEIGTGLPDSQARLNIRGAVREACVLENLNSQFLRTIIIPSNKKSGQDEITAPDLSRETKKRRRNGAEAIIKGRVQSALLDATMRQPGALYGLPSEIYMQAKLPPAIAQNLDVVALCRVEKRQGFPRVQYALAVRLRANGEVDVLLPSASDWIPYHRASIEVGKIFSLARSNGAQKQVQLSNSSLAMFAARVTCLQYDRPTLMLIEAHFWRNGRGGDDKKIWPQLTNPNLATMADILDFKHIAGHNQEYQRQDESFNNLLGVIRLRMGDETPSYVAGWSSWQDTDEPRDFQRISGFYDQQVTRPLHYFSAGSLPETQKRQDGKNVRGLHKFDFHSTNNPDYPVFGANTAFKHPQLVEMVPFFVRQDLQETVLSMALCRAAHYLRVQPAWVMGNTMLPYPMHLGEQLINDQLCIIGAD